MPDFFNEMVIELQKCCKQYSISKFALKNQFNDKNNVMNMGFNMQLKISTFFASVLDEIAEIFLRISFFKKKLEIR